MNEWLSKIHDNRVVNLSLGYYPTQPSMEIRIKLPSVLIEESVNSG